MKKSVVMASIILGVGLSSCNNKTNNSEAEITKEDAVELSNVEKVSALLKSLETGDTAAISYINPEKYIQHNLAFADGLEGFKATVAQLPEATKVNVVRAFEDGDFVFTHSEYDVYGPKIGFDIFRFEDGKIVEHWDNLQETPANPNPSGHSMIDGATKLEDLDKTEENKTLVRNFVEDILMNGKMDKIAGYFDEDNYIQHNPNIPDQLSGLGKTLEVLAGQGIFMKYDTIHKVLGQGNFVLVVAEGHFGNDHIVFYDLFRVANGKIAEHWDVLEKVTPKSEHKNNNGKFNF